MTVYPLFGPISYLAYRVPYLRHVASTFKNLTSTTTHRDLSKFINIYGVSHKVMISNMTLSVVLILIVERKQAIPIELVSDKQSLDFYQSYKLSNYSNSGLVFST